jgi:hypothetical protein
MALAEIELVPFWYVVEDASSTVTFTPADVDIVKLDVDTLATVPDAPPEAGPDRALDPPPPDPEGWVVVELEEVELEEEAAAVPQAARIAVAASKRKDILSDSEVPFDIFFRSFSSLLVT